MDKRLEGKVAIVTGAGQTPGETIGNGRAISLLFARAGVNALTHSIAMRVAKKGIRVNAIMPGLLNTPMAVEGFSEARGISKEDLIRERNNRVPLKGGMGTAWDTAYAALFLASDEARFITSVILPVDGGQCGRIG